MKNVNVSGTGVWLSGGNISSGSPGGLQMFPVENTSIWQANLALPPNSAFTYKFRNGYYPESWSNGWEVINGDCVTGQYDDRFLNVGKVDSLLTAVCFGECLECE